jgi:serine/threonine protein kinase
MSLLVGNFNLSDLNKKLKAIGNGQVSPFAKDVASMCNPKYEFIEYLGCGGETFNFLIKNKGAADRQEVLKIKRPDLNKLTSQRFFRSIKTYIELSGYRCFPLLYFADDELPFMTIEYIKGVSLFDYIKSRFQEMDDEERVNIWKEVSFAISSLHEMGIYHRDIKPKNIIVRDNGTIAVIDYGLARKSGYKSLTMTGSPIGTEFYISPEQWSVPSTVDHRSDIFSMGRLLYFCLVGYDDEFNPEEIPLSFTFVIYKATEVNIESRYQTMAEFLQDVDEAFEQEDEDTARIKLASTREIKKEMIMSALQFNTKLDYIDAFIKLFVVLAGNLQKVMDYTGITLGEARFLLNSARKRIFNEKQGMFEIDFVSQKKSQTQNIETDEE